MVTYSESEGVALISFPGIISFTDSFLDQVTGHFSNLARNNDIRAIVIRVAPTLISAQEQI